MDRLAGMLLMEWRTLKKRVKLMGRWALME